VYAWRVLDDVAFDVMRQKSDGQNISSILIAVSTVSTAEMQQMDPTNLSLRSLQERHERYHPAVIHGSACEDRRLYNMWAAERVRLDRKVSVEKLWEKTQRETEPPVYVRGASAARNAGKRFWKRPITMHDSPMRAEH
jgi:hypothetical protein